MTAWASVDLPLPDRPVKNSTTPCSPGGGRSKSTIAAISSLNGASDSSSARPRTRSPPAYAPTTRTPSSWSVSGSSCDASGTATTAASASRCAAARLARSRPTGERAGVPWPTSATSTTRPSTSARRAIWSSSSASVTGTKVAPVYCSRVCAGRQVEAAERPVLGGGERLDRPVGGDPGQRQALGIDQLEHRLVGQPVRAGQRDGGAGFVEAGDRGKRPRHQQFQVVELSRQRVVLGRVRHALILPPGSTRGRQRRASSPRRHQVVDEGGHLVADGVGVHLGGRGDALEDDVQGASGGRRGEDQPSGGPQHHRRTVRKSGRVDDLLVLGHVEPRHVVGEREGLGGHDRPMRTTRARRLPEAVASSRPSTRDAVQLGGRDLASGGWPAQLHAQMVAVDRDRARDHTDGLAPGRRGPPPGPPLV